MTTNNTDTRSPERKYKAFISYRHKPLDSEYAGKLHKRIERYVIPRDLRKGGEKKLGLVFRDLEELPIADDLDENIRKALDNSEYLIVMCSPDTPGSVWVQREISYFLEHHGRNHVLACLVAGTPEESFPPQLTEIRDESGNLMDIVEPLAANIAADTAQKRNRLFRTESLRLLASLIGCPYDALYRREQRYRTQRLAMAFAAFAAVAAAFICLLLNRNARIRDQLMETKRNESEMLAYISQIELLHGNYRGALEDALNALPGRDPGRPYVASAERGLSNALYLYRHGLVMRYIQSFDQDMQIRTISLSPDQSLLATGDVFGKINLYDVASGKLLWSAKHTEEPKSLDFIGEDLLLVRISGYNHVCLSIKDGAPVWQNTEAVIEEVSPEAGLCLCIAHDSEGNYPFWLIDAKSGEKLLDFGRTDKKYGWIKEAAFSPGGDSLAVLFPYSDEKLVDLWIYDLHTGEGKLIDEGLCFYNTWTDYSLRFGKDGDLALAACGDQSYMSEQEGWDTPFLKLYEADQNWNCRFMTALDFGTTVRAKLGLVDNSDYMDYMEFGSEGIAMASKTRLVMVEPESGKVRYSRDLPDYVVSGHMFQSDDMCLVLANGLVTWCSSTNGTLSYDLTTGFFNCDFNIEQADSGGDHFMEGVSAVVSQSEKRRVCLIAFCGTEGMEPFPDAEKIPGKSRFYYSPAGGKMVSVLNDYDNERFKLCLIDPSGDEALVEMEGNDKWALCTDRTHVFVTEGGKVIMGGKVYDPEEGTELLLTPGMDEIKSVYDLTDASFKRTSDAKILTASIGREKDGTYKLLLWEDGEQIGQKTLPLKPEQSGYDPEFSYCACLAAGGRAVAVYAQEAVDDRKKFAVYLSGEDRWTEAPFLDPEKKEVLALAEEHDWMAVQRSNGALSIFDVSGGAEILTMQEGIPGESVTKLIFADQDKYLLVLTKAGDLAIFSTEDGKMLNRFAYSSSNVRFDDDARYDVQVLPQKQRMLVICDDTTYSEPFCISIDLGSFEYNGFYHAVSGFLPLTDKLVSNASGEEPCYYPLYSVEEMQQLAEEYLEKGRQ